jgi:hypothetical protein
MITAVSKRVVRLVRPFGDGVIMKNKARAFAGIGGLIGAVFNGFMAARKYDFSVTAQMQQGVGYILGGLIVGAIAGYVLGKLIKG